MNKAGLVVTQQSTESMRRSLLSVCTVHATSKKGRWEETKAATRKRNYYWLMWEEGLMEGAELTLDWKANGVLNKQQQTRGMFQLKGTAKPVDPQCCMSEIDKKIIKLNYLQFRECSLFFASKGPKLITSSSLGKTKVISINKKTARLCSRQTTLSGYIFVMHHMYLIFQ